MKRILLSKIWRQHTVYLNVTDFIIDLAWFFYFAVLPTPHVTFAAGVFNAVSHNPFVHRKSTNFDSLDDDISSESESVEVI